MIHFIVCFWVSLKNVQFLILDDTDTMLDMGFEADIRKIVETLEMPEKTEKQTLIFSATFSGEIQRLGGNFLNDYLFLMAGMVVSHQTFSIQSFFFFFKQFYSDLSFTQSQFYIHKIG